MKITFFGLIFLSFILLSYGGLIDKNGEDKNYINDKIYKFLYGNPCVMLADQNGLMGCTSKMDGNTGILYPLNTSQSIEQFLQLKSLFGQTAFIPVLDSSLISDDTLRKLDNSSIVNGLILCSGDSPTNGFSPASTFPNKKYGLHPDSSHIWNPNGNSLNYYQFKKPIFNVNSDNSTDFMNLGIENLRNNSWPKWSVEMNSFMYTSKNSISCLNRGGLCDPVGGLNVWGTFEKNISNSKKKTVLALVSFDSTSLFHTKSVGAESDVSGLAALLGAIDALSPSLYQPAVLEKQLIFAFFNAESYGYTGSKKFLADLKKCTEKGDCTSQQLAGLNLADIDSIVEMRQVGYEGGFYIHQEGSTDNSKVISAVQSSASETGITVNVVQDTSAGIPPSSTMTFLKNSPTIPAVVIADHSTEYRNKYYNSVFDNYETINVDAICNASTLFANTIYKLASSSNSNFNIRVNCSLVQQITFCFTKQLNCEFLQQYLPDLSYANPQPTNYPGIFSLYNPYISTPQVKFIHDFVAQKTYSLGISCSQASTCPPNSLCLQGQCVSSNSSFYHFAYSPGLEMTEDGWKVVDANEPLYTESVWAYTGMRVFRKESPSIDVFMLVVGILHFLIWIVIIFFGTRYFSKYLEL